MSQQIVEMKTKSTFTKEDAILRPMSDESMNGQMSVGLGVLSETFYETALSPCKNLLYLLYIAPPRTEVCANRGGFIESF